MLLVAKGIQGISIGWGLRIKGRIMVVKEERVRDGATHKKHFLMLVI